MKGKPLTQAERLDLYQISLKNVQEQDVIAGTMNEHGYEKKQILEGKALLSGALDSYDQSKTEKDEANASYQHFSDLKDRLSITSITRKLKWSLKMTCRSGFNWILQVSFQEAIQNGWKR